MKFIRVLILLAVAAILLYGIFWERHEIRWETESEIVVYSGPEFLAASSVDRFVQAYDGKLYDQRGTVPAAPDTPGDNQGGAIVSPGETTSPPLSQEVTPEEDCPT
ncbi:MAG: hypothetical protein JXA52_08325 [Planctomycetes bacterium]|nr:hypothetical protein [Planctomycetota bacterium]